MEFLRSENTNFSREWALNIRGKLFTISTPQVMGIVNCTPDSFYASSRKSSIDSQKSLIDLHVENGATWLDIGGYSTRPGAEHISETDEIERIKQAVSYALEKYSTVKISVDTFQSEVANYVLEQGVHLINDISGGLINEELFSIIASHEVPYVLMHMRGTPQNMTQLNSYENMLQEILIELGIQVEKARKAGIKDIIIDPGFGFAKNSEQNLELFSRLEAFQLFDSPILIGISRKSLISKTLGIDSFDSLNGTTVLNTLALEKGANILRVHDVKEAVETVKLWSKIKGIPSPE
ncbi:dihydropteroate synthase [Fluviicola taffensis]|uniref:dihydropteroate synthase n=1 Tax=Fluviicola taffensis (strain DSM 16823 / NCIMB 13979 / RW262) TaxID=755732 RepID=F2I9F9_FLUTR|nr:dihydropteroate synthase [Fluviicola taffensis]AEA45140.1 Dihydropteroate synthase [Fluviicola taffensis DSM 16823]